MKGFFTPKLMDSLLNGLRPMETKCTTSFRLWVSLLILVIIVTTKHLKMTNATMQAPFQVSAPSEVSYEDPVIFIFQTDYTREPYIMCSWDFGDENQLFTTATELQLGISHQYSHPGYYTVLTSCQTSFGRIYHHTQVAVFRDIDWLQCVITDTNAVVQEIFRYGSNIVVHYRHEYTIGLHYSLLIDNVEVYEAIASTMKIQTTVVEDSLIITEYLQHLISLGSHDLTLRVRNGRVDLQCLSTFTLMNPVLGVTLASSHSTVIPRDDVLLAVTAESGFPAMIEWSITNGPSVVLRVLKERQGRLPEDVDQMTISLLEIAEYQICAKVYNNFTSEEACISIETQYPVTSIILESNTPINFAVENTVQFSVQFLDRPIPTSVRYSVDFGDGASGNSSMVGITDSSSFLIIPHTYTTPGIYHATLHVYNDLSSTVNSTRVAVLQPITHMTIRLSHHSGIYFPSSERDWFWQEPPFLHPIVTENEYSFELKGTGTPELVTWRVAGHTQTYHMETTGRNLFYRFPSNGTFNLQATASNFYSSYTTVDASVLVLDAIVSLYLVSNSPGIVGEPITFVVLVESLGSNSSFSVSYGDGFSEPLPEPRHNIDIMQFVPRNLALPTDPAKSYATVMNHTYQEVDFYAPRVTGSNLAMEWIAITYVYVQDVAHLCRIPVIHIRDGGSSYYLAKKYSRSKAFIFGASVEINCQQAKRAHYQWRVYTVDSLFTVPSPSNEVGLPPSVNAQAADMYIPGFTLGYGMYIFQLSVTLVMKEESEASMENVAHSYIEVIPAGLVARIRGGSALATGWYSNITLDASDSFDPDQTPDRASLGLSYTWYCRKSNEPFPENMTLTPHNRLPSTGGCLGKGFLLSQTSTSVVIPAQTLTGNQSYVILLKLSKTGRESAYAEQTIIILLGHPNSIYIRCLMNCGSQLNPSARLVLAGLCPDCTASTQPSFEWSLRSSNHSTAAPALDWARNTTTGKHHPYLAINAGTFSGSSQGTYTIHLQMQSRSGSISFAEYTFTVNSPPTTGNCTITPAEGVVLTTHFSIICEHFEDIHTPLTYEVHTLKAAERSVGGGAHADASVEDTLLFYGLDPNIPATLLPLGQPSQGYRVDIKIKVTDSLGASVYTLLSAVVRESESDDPEALALQLTSDKYSKLNQLMEEGNVQAATQVITSVGSLLNLKSERDNQHQDHGVIEQAVENKHKEELEDQKKKRAQARESLLDMLSKVKVNSLESIQLTSSAISQVTSEVEEISPQAQVSTASAFLSMGSWLKEQADMGVDGDVVEGAATSMVSGLSNIMSSATITQSGNVSDYGPIFESERTQQTRNVTMASLHALDDMQAAILLNKVPGEQPTVLQTSSLSVILQRQEKRGLDGLVLQTENSDVVFRLPAGLSTVIDQHQASSNDEVIDTQIHHFQQNPFSWAKSSSLVTTHVTSLRLGHGDDQSAIAVQTLPQNVEIMVTNGDSVMPVLQPLAGQQTNHSYSFNVTNADAAVIIRIQLNQSSGLTEVLPLHLCLRFELATSDTEPLCNASVTMPRAATDPPVFLNSTNMTFDPYLWVIPSENLPEVGRYYLTLDGGDGTDVTNKQYHVYAFSTQCLFWDKTREEWLGDGCKVGPFTTAAQTHCLCNHLTSFAASFLVLPNPVDLTDFSLFATIPDNPITVVTVAVVFVLFGLCAVWAHRKDRIEREKARLIILADNDQEDTYRYHVTVFTGVRRGAGTTAVVTLTLQGIVGNSEPHVLSSDREHHKVLQRSSVDSFLLTTRESLGILRSVRLWHDNGGSSPAWYLSRILVHDLETDRWWYFLCHTWIAVDLSDGKIDKTFPVANTEDLKDFHHLFFTRSVRDMKDNHLWLSVLSRPPRSSFTRLQRVACCFSLLLSSMLMNIMFYKVGEGEPDKTYNFGVMSLSVKTIVIATEASLLALPINLAIVQIFREARPREKEEVEIVPASESGDSQDQTYQEQEDKGSLDPQGVNLSKAGCADTDASFRSSSIQSQTSSMPKSASRGSTQHKVSQPQNPRREDTKPLASRESLPERDIFSSDKAYEEYTDKYAEFVYLRSTCTSANASSHRSLETGSWHSMIPLERNPSSIHAQQAFRLDLLPECDQALMSTNMTELTKTARNSNANHNSSSSESSIQPRSSQSNTTSCSASSIKILISPSEESSIDPGSSDSVIYTSYQDFLSSRLNRLYEQLHNPSPGLFRSDQDRQKALRKFKLALALHGWREERERESGSESSNETLPEQKDKVQKLFSGRGFLPWWWVYIGWFLAISSSLFAAYLIILYGLTFGKQKSLDWLVSMIVSLFQSIVVIQPVKVIAIAAFFAIVLKSYDYDEIGVTFFKQLKIYAGGRQSSTTSTQSKHRDSHFYRPPTGRAVEQAREKRHAERKMYSLIKAFLGHLVFIWLVLQVSIAQRDPAGIYLSLAMRSSFTTKLDQVKTMPDVYTWIKGEFAPSLYEAEPGTALQESLLVGSPRLRQQRVKPGYLQHCRELDTYRYLRPGCYAVRGTELDQGAYNASWTQPLSSNNTSQHQSRSPWVYQSHWQAKGSYFLTDPGRYNRGGFLLDLGTTRASTANQTALLQDLGWVDQYTQAIILEWVVYNANTNLFCACTVVFRAEGTTTVVPSHEFAIVCIYRYTNKYDKFVVILEVLYVMVVTVIMGMEVLKWKNNRREYWAFWNVLNIAIIILSISATTAYIWQHVLANNIMQLYKANHNMHLSFADIVVLDSVLVTSLASVAFCSLLKCLKILHYNDSMYLLHSTFRRLTKTLLIYLSMLTVTFVAFAYYGYLSFGRQFRDFCDLLRSIQCVFMLILRRYSDMLDIMEAFGMQAYFFFALANFFLIAVIVNLFIAMLLHCYSAARSEFVRYKDHDMVSMLSEWFLSAFSIKGQYKRVHKHNSIASVESL